MKTIFKKTKGWLVIGLLVLMSYVSFAFGTSYFELSKNLDIFATLYKQLNIYYVDETEPGELMETAIDAMLESLDPYTTYIPESDIEDFRIQTTGQYGGIGALIRKSESAIIISEPYQDYPADKAGLKAGDSILKIDGKEVGGKSTEDVSSVLKGEPGTEVKLLIERPGEKSPIEKVLTREEVKIKSIPYYGMVEDGIGYIRLRSFTPKCSEEVKEAFLDLKKQHELEGLVIDLRGNPGGLLVEAINTCNIFVQKGQEVVSTKGKVKDWEKTYPTTQMATDTEIPLTVLVDQGSASASEIVSGTLQDLDRAVIIGNRTFGKGLVQQTMSLSYKSELKVTTAKYYTPSGRCIQAINYADKNEDGSVGKLPDSLRTEFKTLHGRSVFDGGGIDPDIDVEQDEFGLILISLISKMLIFDYATNYVLQHESIAAPEDFEVTDEMFESFVSFLDGKDYEYETRTEQQITRLKEIAEDEEYMSQMQDVIDGLEQEFAKHKADDLHRYKDQIKDFLRSEIVTRYYYQKGRIKAELQDDKDLAAALEVLKDQERYKSILSGKN